MAIYRHPGLGNEAADVGGDTGTQSVNSRPIVQEAVAAAVNGALSTENSLVAACQAGDTTAYGELVRLHQDRVFNVCWRVCGNRTEAEDLAQEVFVRAFESIGRFDGRARFYTWLYRIAVNLSISSGRRQQSARTLSLDGQGRRRNGAEWSAGERLEADVGPPDENMTRQESNTLVLGALASLEDEFRAVVTLRDLESLSYEEIAEVLEVPVGTVKSRLHRARLALREKLAPIFENR